MTKKLAVLISGSFRNFDQVWDKNKAIIEELKVPYEVFFHTWEENLDLSVNVLETEFKNKFYFSIYPKRYLSFRKEISEKYISETYHFFRVWVEPFPEKYLSETYKLGNPSVNSRYRALLNSTAMYYGINKCGAELLKSNTFTHYLRLRPDFILDPSGIAEIFHYDLTFFGQLLPTPDGPIGDQCFGGEISKTVQILNLQNTLEEITRDQAWDISKPMVLAEDVIRRRLKPFRADWRIQYLEGHGRIFRPKLIRSKFDRQSLIEILNHNLKTLSFLPLRACRLVDRKLSSLRFFNSRDATRID